MIAKKLPTAAVVEEGKEKLHRATGGRTSEGGATTGKNAKAEAERLIKLAERIKKRQGNGTSALLNLDDTTVAKALAVANRNI